MKKIVIILFALSMNLVVFSCSSSDDADQLIDIGFNSKLIFEDNNISESHKDEIELVTKETVALVNSKMSTENITIRVRTAPSRTIPEIGIGGFNPNENEVIMSLDPNFSNFSQSIAIEFGPLLAHEIHHAKRRRSVGYGNTLLEAIITEGLADSFSVELFGIDPPLWSNALSESELELWLNNAQDSWNNSNYNHAAWFFGSTPNIPRWAGYSIGFKLVQDYLAKNPTKRPSNLHNEEANSFIK